MTKQARLWMMAAILVFGASVFTSCSKDDDPTGQQDEYAGVPLIILDTDIGSSTDDLIAMEMLYHYETQDMCKLLDIIVAARTRRTPPMPT